MIDPAVISLTPEAFILEVVAPERIVVINLERRADRWDALQAAWHPEVARLFTRFSAVDGLLLPPERIAEYLGGRELPYIQAAGETGCRDSWIQAVERYGPGLYFEDDARPCLPWPYGPPPQDAEIVLLGGSLARKSSVPGWRLVITAAAGAQAVWIHTRRAADLLLNAWRNEGFPADVTWNRPLIETHAVLAVPQIVYQIDLGTDVQVGRTYQSWEPVAYDPWCSLRGGNPEQ